MESFGGWFNLRQGVFGGLIPEVQPIASPLALTVPLRPVGTADAVCLSNGNKVKGERMKNEKSGMSFE